MNRNHFHIVRGIWSRKFWRFSHFWLWTWVVYSLLHPCKLHEFDDIWRVVNIPKEIKTNLIPRRNWFRSMLSLDLTKINSDLGKKRIVQDFLRRETAWSMVRFLQFLFSFHDFTSCRFPSKSKFTSVKSSAGEKIEFLKQLSYTFSMELLISDETFK